MTAHKRAEISFYADDFLECFGMWCKVTFILIVFEIFFDVLLMSEEATW